MPLFVRWTSNARETVAVDVDGVRCYLTLERDEPRHGAPFRVVTSGPAPVEFLEDPTDPAWRVIRLGKKCLHYTAFYSWPSGPEDCRLYLKIIAEHEWRITCETVRPTRRPRTRLQSRLPERKPCPNECN